jgi:hypothetical protein
MRILLVLVTLVVAACSSDDPAPPADAASSVPCTGKLYDSCDPNASNCMSPYVCKAYGNSEFSVCVPPQGDCTTNGCPMQGTQTPSCNNMGYCKPAAPNADCTAP